MVNRFCVDLTSDIHLYSMGEQKLKPWTTIPYILHWAMGNLQASSCKCY